MAYYEDLAAKAQELKDDLLKARDEHDSPDWPLKAEIFNASEHAQAIIDRMEIVKNIENPQPAEENE